MFGMLNSPFDFCQFMWEEKWKLIAFHRLLACFCWGGSVSLYKSSGSVHIWIFHPSPFQSPLPVSCTSGIYSSHRGLWSSYLWVSLTPGPPPTPPHPFLDVHISTPCHPHTSILIRTKSYHHIKHVTLYSNATSHWVVVTLDSMSVPVHVFLELVPAEVTWSSWMSTSWQVCVSHRRCWRAALMWLCPGTSASCLCPCVDGSDDGGDDGGYGPGSGLAPEPGPDAPGCILSVRLPAGDEVSSRMQSV